MSFPQSIQCALNAIPADTRDPFIQKLRKLPENQRNDLFILAHSCFETGCDESTCCCGEVYTALVQAVAPSRSEEQQYEIYADLQNLFECGLLTPENFNVVVSHKNSSSMKSGLIVLSEGNILTDENRGFISQFSCPEIVTQIIVRFDLVGILTNENKKRLLSHPDLASLSKALMALHSAKLLTKKNAEILFLPHKDMRSLAQALDALCVVDCLTEQNFLLVVLSEYFAGAVASICVELSKLDRSMEQGIVSRDQFNKNRFQLAARILQDFGVSNETNRVFNKTNTKDMWVDLTEVIIYLFLSGCLVSLMKEDAAAILELIIPVWKRDVPFRSSRVYAEELDFVLPPNVSISSCVSHLEKLNTPNSIFAAAQLLNSNYGNPPELDKGSKADREYREKRLHDAISLYVKAANRGNAHISELVNFTLFHMQVTYGNIDSVKVRLSEYDTELPCGLGVRKGVMRFRFFSFPETTLANSLTLVEPLGIKLPG